MKKLSILLIGLLLVSGFAFAQEFDPSVDLSGEASVTWGVDLNTNYTGFQNAASSTLTLTLVPEADATTGGDDGLYGEITISDFGWENGVADGSVTAKIVVDPAEIIIYSEPGFDYDMAPTIDEGAVVEGDIAVALTSANTLGGITVSVPVDPITVDLKLASDGDWETNTENDYAIGTDVEVAVDPVTLTLGFTYGYFSAPILGISAKADVSLDVVEGLDAYVAMDGVQPDAGDFDWDLAAGAALALTEETDDFDSSMFTVDSYVYVGDPDTDLDIVIGIDEVTAGGFVDMLGAGVTVELFDILVDLEWNVDVTGEYDTGDVMPYFGFGYGSDEVFDLNVGVELYAGMTGIDNTTIVLDYVSENLETDNGIITLATTVSF